MKLSSVRSKSLDLNTTGCEACFLKDVSIEHSEAIALSIDLSLRWVFVLGLGIDDMLGSSLK